MSCQGGGGGWTTICADVSTVIILNLFSTRSVAAAATCHLLYPDSWSNTCQLLCHSLSSLYQPPSDPLINLVSSWLTGRPAAYQTGPNLSDVNCATSSESISVLEKKKIGSRMLSHYSTIQLSVWKDVRTRRADAYMSPISSSSVDASYLLGSSTSLFCKRWMVKKESLKGLEMRRSRREWCWR